MARSAVSKYIPWNDRGGRLSPLKLTTFILVLLPGLWMIGEFATGTLGARPINEVIHEIGTWALRLLLIGLAVTPFRRIFRWGKLVLLRRMIGVAAAVYVMIHLIAYMADLQFDLGKIASEIVLRIYLTIGAVALVGILALGITSTDGMVRRLGGVNWQRLHNAIYVLVLLGLVHFFMQAKLEVYEPLIMSGLFAWLIAYRLLAWRLQANPSIPTLAGLAVVVAAATAFGEALYFNLKLGVGLELVLGTNLTLDTGLRPGAVVLMATLAVPLFAVIQQFLPKGMPKRSPA